MEYFYMSVEDLATTKKPILGDKYARAAGSKGVGESREHEWLINDMSEELTPWGHPGGEGGHIIIRSDGERSIMALRNALAKHHGGKVIQECLPPGVSQSNGSIEEAGKTVREFTRVLKEQVEDRVETILGPEEDVAQWMLRWAAIPWARTGSLRTSADAVGSVSSQRCALGRRFGTRSSASHREGPEEQDAERVGGGTMAWTPSQVERGDHRHKGGRCSSICSENTG